MDHHQRPVAGNLIVVVGPTAVGKTELCVRLAQHFQTVILSADSRQIYHELTVGTAKPTAAEMHSVPHYFINSHHVHQEYSAGAYEKDVLALLAELFVQYRDVILTGGSGLYVRAVLEGLDDLPEVPAAVRQRLIKIELEQGLAPLLTQLQQLDPVYYQQVDRANPQRIIRALEITLATGKPYSSFRTKQPAQRPFNSIKIGLNRDRTELYTRIDARLEQMLENGLLEEVKGLTAYQDRNALQTVGYREIFDYLAGQYDWSEAVRLLKRNSRRYAKRQLTWFNKNADFSWFHPTDWDTMLAFIEQHRV